MRYPGPLAVSSPVGETVVGQQGVLVLPFRTCGADVHGGLDEFRNLMQKSVMCLD